MASKDKMETLAMAVEVLEGKVASLDDGTIGSEGTDLVWRMGRHLEQTYQLLEQLADRMPGNGDEEDGK